MVYPMAGCNEILSCPGHHKKNSENKKIPLKQKDLFGVICNIVKALIL
jgi:hypothetical protein